MVSDGNYLRLKYLRDRLLNRYIGARDEQHGYAVLTKLWDEFEEVDLQYQRLMGRK